MATPKKYIVERFYDQIRYRAPRQGEEDRTFDSEAQCHAFMVQRAESGIAAATKELSAAHRRYRQCVKRSIASGTSNTA